MKLHPFFFCFLFAFFLLSCSDNVEDTSGYYFRPVEGQEEKLPSDLKFRTKGGNFEVMFDTGQTWTAAVQGEDQGWVHISQAEGEAGIQSIELTIDPNLAEESRSASIMILARTVGKRIKINQLGTKDERAKASRSVLAYMAAENSLNSYATQDLAEMIEGMKGVTEDNKLLVYVDDVKFPRMYEIAPNEIGVPDTVRVVDYPIEYDSSDPATLVMALDYMKENYEAEEYGLVMWSHGEGWTPGTTRYIGVDNNQNTTSNSGLKMGIGQLRDAIHQTVGNLEFLFFDACFMMTAEVAYELRDCAHYLIGSPCEIPAPGAPYQLTASAMFDKEISRGGIAQTYYQYYQDKYGSISGPNRYGAVLATLDCAAWDTFADITRTVVQRNITESTSFDTSGWIQYGFNNAPAGYSRTNMYLDMKEVMQSVLVPDDYMLWENAFKDAVLSLHATDFWYAASKGVCSLDLSIAGGLAMTLPMVIKDEKELEDLSKMAWYTKVWK